MAYFWTIFSMAVWDTFRRSVATVANRRLDIAQRVVDRVAENTENTRRPIFVRVELGGAREVPLGYYTTRVRVDGPSLRWFLEGTPTCAVALPHFGMLCCLKKHHTIL
jgi:hypothetical protein